MLKKNYSLYLLFFLLYIAIGCKKSSISDFKIPVDNTIFAAEELKNYNLRDYIQILTDSSKEYTIAEIIKPENQVLFQDRSKISGTFKSEKDYWARVQIVNTHKEAEHHIEWVLNISNTFTFLEVFTLKEDGIWSKEVNGSFLSADQKKFKPSRTGNWTKVVLQPNQPVTIFFKGRNDRKGLPPAFVAYLQPMDVFYDELILSKTWSTLFTGFLAMMLIYNLLNFFFTKDRSYLYYTGYLLMILIYTSYTTDDLKDWIGAYIFVENPKYFSLFKIALYLGLMSYLAFICSFLDLEHLLPKWNKYFKFLIWLGLPLTIIFIILALRFNFNFLIDDRITLGYIFLVSISALLLIYPLLKTKDKKGKFITAGITVVSLGCILTINSRMTQVPFSVFYLKLGTILEILIFSMGLAYRHRQQVLGKQEADFALRESQFLQEQNHKEAEKLKELNDFKSNFFTNMSHEFRTPLTVILGMTDQLMNKEIDTNKKEKLSLVKRNSESLLHLINQILDLAKLESSSLKVHYIQGNVIVYLRYIIESLHSLANAQNLMLRVKSDQTSIIMDYDPERLLQIIHNLLSNAIKFTPSGGQISVTVTKEGSWLHILVSDSGVGINEAEIPLLFERFYQASNQHHSKTTGTGVGLSLVAQLIKIMGGDISVQSIVGKGTTFEIKLPITNNEPIIELPQIPSSFNDLVFSGLKKLDGNETFSEEEELLKPLVLIIEDNPDVVSYLKFCLQDHYTLEYAYNGRSGIEKAILTIPDLIVSDVMMPEKDGFEVVETLKRDERTSHIPMILLTAKADIQSRIKGIREGADSYLTKPFNQEELIVLINNLLETRKKLHLKYRKNVLNTQVELDGVTSENIDDAFLQNTIKIIDANYKNEEFGLPQLCQKIGMSRSQLFRKLKALTDIAPSDLIRKHRLNKARNLIKNEQTNVNEASWQVGFKDPSHFSKLYQEEFGELPSATRK